MPQATVLCGIRQKGGCLVPIPAPLPLPILTALQTRHSEQRDAAQQMFRSARFQYREARQMTASAHRMFAAAQLLRDRMKRPSRLALRIVAISN